MSSNPYGTAASMIRKAQLQQRQQMLLCQPERPPFHNQQNRSSSADMGIQSQFRDGAIKACKKRCRTKFNYREKGSVRFVQMAVHMEGEAFNPKKHCQICFIKDVNDKAGREVIRVPKRKHHDKCPRRHPSKRQPRSHQVQKIAAANIANNKRPVGNLGRPATRTEADAALYPWKLLNMNVPADTAASAATTSSKDSKDVAGAGAAGQFEFRKVINAAHLNGTYDKFGKSRAPAVIECLLKHMIDQFKHKKTPGPVTTTNFNQAMERYHSFFPPGDVIYTFPKDRSSSLPDPLYHSVEGKKVFYLDWELSHSKECSDMGCPSCGCKLARTETNYSKNKTLFPVFRKSGVMWGVVMGYKCTGCNDSFKANCGSLLASLPGHVRQDYPVDPRYAGGNKTLFHLDVDLTQDIDGGIRTYCNGNMYSRLLHENQAKAYCRALENYFSLGGNKPYPLFADWIGIYPPSGDTLRRLYNKAERSPNTPTGVSNYVRHKREIQSVQEAAAIAIDWTFQVLKNYALPGAVAAFTLMTSTRQVAAFAIVGSVAVTEVAHLVEQMIRRRPQFRPKVIYTDTWPANKLFWTTLLQAEGRLGLFHCMQRIIDTMNCRCDLYWEALFALRMCFYKYDDDDLENVYNSLKEGTFNGHKHSSKDITELQCSSKWKQLCEPHLKKDIYGKTVIVQNLNQWLQRWAYQIDTRRRPLCPANSLPMVGRKTDEHMRLGTPTIDAIHEQEKKVEFLKDPLSFNPYRQIPTRPGSKKPPKYESDRPEAHCENAHKYMQHFGNGGMNPELADVLTIGGIAERNCNVRHGVLRDKGIFVTEYPNGKEPPLHHDDCAVFKDHLYLQFINKMAEKKGVTELPFFNLFHIKEDNQEDMGSEYYYSQQARNKNAATRVSVQHGGRCRCPQCLGNPQPYMNELGVQDVNNMIKNGTTTTKAAMLSEKRASITVPPQPAQQQLAPRPVFTNPQVFVPYQLPQIPPAQIRYKLAANFRVCGCLKVQEYLVKKYSGKSVRGAPPKHLPGCQHRKTS